MEPPITRTDPFFWLRDDAHQNVLWACQRNFGIRGHGQSRRTWGRPSLDRILGVLVELVLASTCFGCSKTLPRLNLVNSQISRTYFGVAEFKCCIARTNSQIPFVYFGIANSNLAGKKRRWRLKTTGSGCLLRATTKGVARTFLYRSCRKLDSLGTLAKWIS